jgi:hypothetical protein
MGRRWLKMAAFWDAALCVLVEVAVAVDFETLLGVSEGRDNPLTEQK